MLGGRITVSIFLHNRFMDLDKISNQIATDLRILYGVNADIGIDPKNEAAKNCFKNVCQRIFHNLQICEQGLDEVPALAKLG